MKNLTLKKGLVVVFLLAAMNTAFASKAVVVPQRVSTAFAEKYAGAKHIRWTETNDEFKAEFKLNGQAYQADFTEDGQWKSSIAHIRVGQMPMQLKAALRQSRFASYYIDDIELVTTLDHASYQLTIDNHNGFTIPTEGYGSWEDYRINLEINGKITNATEL